MLRVLAGCSDPSLDDVSHRPEPLVPAEVFLPILAGGLQIELEGPGAYWLRLNVTSSQEFAEASGTARSMVIAVPGEGPKENFDVCGGMGLTAFLWTNLAGAPTTMPLGATFARGPVQLVVVVLDAGRVDLRLGEGETVMRPELDANVTWTEAALGSHPAPGEPALQIASWTADPARHPQFIGADMAMGGPALRVDAEARYREGQYPCGGTSQTVVGPPVLSPPVFGVAMEAIDGDDITWTATAPGATGSFEGSLYSIRFPWHE